MPSRPRSPTRKPGEHSLSPRKEAETSDGGGWKAVDLTGAPGGPQQRLREALSIPDAAAERLSPLRPVHPGSPPTLVMHGTEDRVVPIDRGRRFRDRMTAEGNHCGLMEYVPAACVGISTR
ncbi:prolyl oligopeptidase family serine peptidase [Streptomyces sp. NPDC002012]|uniref:alpha/beta hydrolase family protein n=1 Tax=Streptomyces sp. NPDC002012 TaxID=3154532 RepID=UPI00332AA686